MPDKRGDEMSASKLGRPTDNPRRNKISIRINDRSKELLDRYCSEKGVTKTDAIERGIIKLEEDLKK